MFIALDSEQSDGLFSNEDGISTLPEKDAYLLYTPTHEDNELFDKKDEDFLCQCSRHIRKVIGETKKHRNPLTPEWKNGLPIFLCGGSQMEFYKEAVKQAEARLKGSKYEVILTHRKLPKLEQLSGRF